MKLSFPTSNSFLEISNFDHEIKFSNFESVRTSNFEHVRKILRHFFLQIPALVLRLWASEAK